MVAELNFEKTKEIIGRSVVGRSGEAWFNHKAEKMAKENGISKEAAQRSILQKRHNKFGGFIGKGPVNKIEIKSKQDTEEAEPNKDEKKSEKEPAKKKKPKYLESDILFYRSKEAKRIESTLKKSLAGENLKDLHKDCELFYRNIEEDIQADANNQAEIKKVYEKKYIKYAPGEDVPNGKIKKDNFIKGLEAHAKEAAMALEGLKILNGRVEDKLAALESSPDRDKKMRELIKDDPEFGADLFKIAEINEHLRKEEKRWQREMAAPKRFAEVGKSLENDLGRGCIFSLVFFVGKFFKIAWQSAFLKGQKADKKVQHFFKELTEETFKLVGTELYYAGSFVGKGSQAVIAGAGKVANVNRQSIGEGIERAKKFRDETSEKLREAIYGSRMAPTD